MYLYMLQKQLHHRLDQWLRTEGMLQALSLVQGNQQEHILVQLLLMLVLALRLMLLLMVALLMV